MIPVVLFTSLTGGNVFLCSSFLLSAFGALLNCKKCMMLMFNCLFTYFEET